MKQVLLWRTIITCVGIHQLYIKSVGISVTVKNNSHLSLTKAIAN